MKIKCYKPNNVNKLDQFGNQYREIHSWDFEWFFQYRELTEQELSGEEITPHKDSLSLLSKIGLIGNPHRRKDCFFYEMMNHPIKGTREIEVSPSDNPYRYPSIIFPGINTVNLETCGLREINTLIHFIIHHKTLHYFSSEHPFELKYSSLDKFPNVETFSTTPPSKDLYKLVEEIPVKVKRYDFLDLRDQVIGLLPFRIIQDRKKRKG